MGEVKYPFLIETVVGFTAQRATDKKQTDGQMLVGCGRCGGESPQGARWRAQLWAVVAEEVALELAGPAWGVAMLGTAFRQREPRGLRPACQELDLLEEVRMSP